MGSPMVFQTAPPQPWSKARMICSPQLVGGPEANQNGLGLRMPAKLVVRSAMLVAQERLFTTEAQRHGEKPTDKVVEICDFASSSSESDTEVGEKTESTTTQYAYDRPVQP